MVLGKVDDAQFQAWANRVRGKIDRDVIKKEIGKSSKRIGVQALKQFKANTPVDTGTLRRNWSVEGPVYASRAWIITMTNNTEYAAWVENGHRTPSHTAWVPGQFFMRASLNQINSQLPLLITPTLWAFRGLFE